MLCTCAAVMGNSPDVLSLVSNYLGVQVSGMLAACRLKGLSEPVSCWWCAGDHPGGRDLRACAGEAASHALSPPCHTLLSQGPLPLHAQRPNTRQAVFAHPMVAAVVLQKVPNPERNFFVREEQQELSRRISLIARRKGLFWTLLGLTTFFAFMIRSPYIGCVAEDGAAAPPITDCAGVYGCFDSSATCPFTARTG